MIGQTLQVIEGKMRSSIEVLKRSSSSIRTGRASPALIEHIRVEYAGVPIPLNQIAGISAPEARLLVVQPWDKNSLHDIEKAIMKSDLGLNPSSDGNVLRLNIPPLSEERRQELIKVVRSKVEEERVEIRNLRREAMDELRRSEKQKDISQDQLKRALGQLQKITDSFIDEAEQIGRDKEAALSVV